MIMVTIVNNNLGIDFNTTMVPTIEAIKIGRQVM